MLLLESDVVVVVRYVVVEVRCCCSHTVVEMFLCSELYTSSLGVLYTLLCFRIMLLDQ